MRSLKLKRVDQILRGGGIRKFADKKLFKNVMGINQINNKH